MSDTDDGPDEYTGEGDGDEPRWILAAGAYRLERLIVPIVFNALSTSTGSLLREEWDAIELLVKVAHMLDQIHEGLDPDNGCAACSELTTPWVPGKGGP